MAGMGNQNDRFAPGQAQEVSLYGKSGYQLGKIMPAPLIPNVLGNTPCRSSSRSMTTRTLSGLCGSCIRSRTRSGSTRRPTL